MPIIARAAPPGKIGGRAIPALATQARISRLEALLRRSKVPGGGLPATSSLAYNPLHIKTYREHDFYLVKLEELIKKYPPIKLIAKQSAGTRDYSMASHRMSDCQRARLDEPRRRSRRCI
jgi:hypothetical protein